MHIGLVIYGDLEVISGGYLYDKQLVSFWRSQGHKVSIFSLPWRSYWRHFEDNFSRQWVQQIISAKLDILVQDELNHPSLIGLNPVIKQHRNIPIVSIIHLLRCSEPHPAYKKLFYKQIESLYLNQMDGFIFNSYDTMRQVNLLTRENKPSVMAYPGRDHWSIPVTDEEIVTRSSTEDPIRILYVGNYIKRKGLRILLSELAQLSEPIWQLTAIGRRDLEPEYVNEIEAFVRNRGISEQVNLMGPIEPEKMSAHYQAHQLFIMLSLYEPFGIVYLEAMGAGLPVVASTAGAGQELIRHGQNGYLISLSNTHEIVGFVRQYHQDRRLLAQMGIQAKKHYDAHPSWAETGKKVTDFLASLVRSQNHS